MNQMRFDIKQKKKYKSKVKIGIKKKGVGYFTKILNVVVFCFFDKYPFLLFQLSSIIALTKMDFLF